MADGTTGLSSPVRAGPIQVEINPPILRAGWYEKAIQDNKTLRSNRSCVLTPVRMTDGKCTKYRITSTSPVSIDVGSIEFHSACQEWTINILNDLIITPEFGAKIWARLAEVEDRDVRGKL
ncbi:unnamed protein product [marine sediment metagenome]|uniref:Uncharacterized protein n=1 Tax=marine sediment metagenome TaxID=412755 RepID=X0U8R7_9ZZZZ